MPSRDEVLRDLVRQVGDLTERVSELERQGRSRDPWDEDFIEPEDREEGDPPLVSVQVTDDQIEVTVPAPTPEQITMREQFIAAGGLDNIDTLNPEVAKEAYLKGGPIWLHAGDRDYVMSLPLSYRKQMAEDVYVQDHQLAGELARDILKDEGGDENSEWAMHQAEALFNG